MSGQRGQNVKLIPYKAYCLADFYYFCAKIKTIGYEYNQNQGQNV